MLSRQSWDSRPETGPGRQLFQRWADVQGSRTWGSRRCDSATPGDRRNPLRGHWAINRVRLAPSFLENGGMRNSPGGWIDRRVGCPNRIVGTSRLVSHSGRGPAITPPPEKKRRFIPRFGGFVTLWVNVRCSSGWYWARYPRPARLSLRQDAHSAEFFRSDEQRFSSRFSSNS